MSFSKSTRFPECRKEIIPGPGSYEVKRGKIGSDSVKFKIHNTPRFAEVCKKNCKGRRECTMCTISDIKTAPSSSKNFAICPSSGYSIQNITFRRSRPTAPEFRKALRDLIFFRQNFAKKNNAPNAEEGQTGTYFSEESELSNTDDPGYSSSQHPTRTDTSDEQDFSTSRCRSKSEPKLKKSRKTKAQSSSDSSEESESNIKSKSQPRLRWKIPSDSRDFQFTPGTFECGNQESESEKNSVSFKDDFESINSRFSSLFCDEFDDGSCNSHGKSCEVYWRKTYILKCMEILEKKLVKLESKKRGILNLISVLEGDVANLCGRGDGECKIIGVF